MPEPTPYILSRCFSQLIGRKVTFVQTTFAPDTKIKKMYGIYTLLPHETAIIVKADLQLLGSFGGALVGLPDSAVKEHLRVAPVDELLRDAIFRGAEHRLSRDYLRGSSRLRQDGDRPELFRWRCRKGLQVAGPQELFQCSSRWIPRWQVHYTCPVRSG